MALFKIYKLPNVWIALYSDGRARSWFPNLSEDRAVKAAKRYEGIPLEDMMEDEEDALLCWQGAKEEYLFWSADSEKKEIVSNKKCSCPDENFKFFGIGCVCGAMKK